MGWRGWNGHGFKPYVSVAQRRASAMREMEKLRRKGHPVAPVVIEGRDIARTFWGKAWCNNLECYSDFANRLPRGRTYVRNGSVVDLQIAQGEVTARVAGSELYAVRIRITPLRKERWRALCGECAGGISSLVELLQGRFGKGVMERVCEPGRGLFPTPDEIALDCSCPDWAGMCKHVAAVLYGVGARLDDKPELLFRLREVDESELVAVTGKDLGLAAPAQPDKVLAAGELDELFGLELGAAAGPQPAPVAAVAAAPAPALGPESGEASPGQRRRGRRKERVPSTAAVRDVGASVLGRVGAMAPAAAAGTRPEASLTDEEYADLRAAVAREVRAALAGQIELLERLSAFLTSPGRGGAPVTRREARGRGAK